MLLSELKQHLRAVNKVSLQALAKHFNTEADAIRFMLQRWLQGGQVRCVMAKPACGSLCRSCKIAEVEIYEWVSS